MSYNSDFDFCLLVFTVPKHFENSVCFHSQVDNGGRRNPNQVGLLEKTFPYRHMRASARARARAHTHTHTHKYIYIYIYYIYICMPACCRDQPISMSRDSFRMQSVLQPSDAVVCVCMLGWSQPSGSPTARISSKMWTQSPLTTQFCSTRTSPTISSTWRYLSTIGGRRAW